MAWPIWATCTLPGLWCWGSGVLAGVDRQGAQGGEGQVRLLFLWRSASGGALQHREGVRPTEGWICRSIALGVCVVQASSLAGTGSLWDFGWGMGQGDGTGEGLFSLPSCALSSGAQQLSLPLSSSPPVLQAELLAYNLPDVKSYLLSEHTPPAPSLLQASLRGSAWPACRPSAPAPSRQSIELAPPHRPSSPLPWASRLRLALETPFC